MKHLALYSGFKLYFLCIFVCFLSHTFLSMYIRKYSILHLFSVFSFGEAGLRRPEEEPEGDLQRSGPARRGGTGDKPPQTRPRPDWTLEGREPPQRFIVHR